jgi:MoaA/NifB/PqqE/SkfB family radical SAM enzyme
MITQLAIIVTNRCNLKCDHCLRGYPGERDDFPLDLFSRLLIEAMPFGARHVALTGGEPFLHPEFDRVIELISSAGYSWHFVTNGIESDPYLKVIDKHQLQPGHVTLSLDGTTADTHDQNRNRKGAFDRALSSAQIYREKNIPLHIAMTINRNNIDQVEDMFLLAQEMGADSLHFGGTISVPWNQDLVLSDRESVKIYKRIEQIEDDFGFDVTKGSALNTRGGINHCNILNLSNLTFNTKGELLFCCDTVGNGAGLGSLHEQEISELILNWLQTSANLQKERAKQIASGQMGKGFDTCYYCNRFFTN